MHKKLVTLALSSILSLSLSLTGCNSNEDVENPQVKQEETVQNEASHEQDEVNKEEQVNEICDLTYHLLVLLNELNIPLEDVCTELKNRRNKINNFKGERKAIDNR